MSGISAVIITFNEERYIERCIRSLVEVADEIVVIDSLSTDRTPEICRTLGVRYIEHPFMGYRDQKQFALTQASFDYVLSLDADEALSPELEKSIIALKQDFKYDGYKFNRLNSFCGRWMYHTNLFPECKIRLFNRKKAHWGGYNIHETVILDRPRNVHYLKGNLLHWLCDNYEENVDKINKYTTLLANEYFKQGIKVSAKKLLINPLWRFYHSYFIKGGFLDGFDGFVVSKLLATTCFLKYVKLRKLYIQAKRSKERTDNRVNIVNADQTGTKEEKPRPISIGFDAKRAFFNYTGLGNYCRNLLSALSKHYPDNSYYLFTPKTNNRIVMEDENVFRIIEPGSHVLRTFNSLWRRKYMVNDFKQHSLDIFHGLSLELPVGIENSGVKSVVTVHDLIFMRFPEFYSRIDAKIYFKKLAHACRVADSIVAISNQTKNDLIRFLNISPDKISVIHQGCNHYFWNKYEKEFHHEVRTKYNLPERYLLYVGTVEERKNLLGLVKAIHITKIDLPLIVIGRKTNQYYKKVLNYIKTNNLKKIIFLEGILNLDLPVIYQNAECFIYPSLSEGFGIPLLEALVSGIPVVTSKGGCFEEAAGPGSLYVDPNSPEKIGEAILRVISSKDLRDKMTEMGFVHANKLKDDDIAQSYMNLYRSLLK